MCCLLSRPLNQGATTLRVQLVEGIFCSSFHPAKTPVLTLLQVPDKGQGTYKLAAATPRRPAVGMSSQGRPALSNPAGVKMHKHIPNNARFGVFFQAQGLPTFPGFAWWVI